MCKVIDFFSKKSLEVNYPLLINYQEYYELLDKAQALKENIEMDELYTDFYQDDNTPEHYEKCMNEIAIKKIELESLYKKISEFEKENNIIQDAI